MDKVAYYRFGKKYFKLGRNEIIKKGAMQSWCHGELQPVKNSDGRTIGSKPSDFSDERDFYNPAPPETQTVCDCCGSQSKKVFWNVYETNLLCPHCYIKEMLNIMQQDELESKKFRYDDLPENAQQKAVKEQIKMEVDLFIQDTTSHWLWKHLSDYITNSGNQVMNSKQIEKWINYWRYETEQHCLDNYQDEIESIIRLSDHWFDSSGNLV